jgi:hypothetical protein
MRDQFLQVQQTILNHQNAVHTIVLAFMLAHEKRNLSKKMEVTGSKGMEQQT